MDLWWNGVNMVNVTGGVLVGAGVGGVSWVMSQRSMSSISSFALTSKISSITFVIVKVPQILKTREGIVIC